MAQLRYTSTICIIKSFRCRLFSGYFPILTLADGAIHTLLPEYSSPKEKGTSNAFRNVLDNNVFRENDQYFVSNGNCVKLND